MYKFAVVAVPTVSEFLVMLADYFITPGEHFGRSTRVKIIQTILLMRIFGRPVAIG